MRKTSLLLEVWVMHRPLLYEFHYKDLGDRCSILMEMVQPSCTWATCPPLQRVEEQTSSTSSSIMAHTTLLGDNLLMQLCNQRRPLRCCQGRWLQRGNDSCYTRRNRRLCGKHAHHGRSSLARGQSEQRRS